jgi:hypothetical protein
MTFIPDLPIARYLCRRKRKPKLNDLTFSLLPHFLIPYYAPTLDTFMESIRLKLFESNSNIKILDQAYAHIDHPRFNFTERNLSRYIKVFEQTRIKIKLFFIQHHINQPINMTLCEVYQFLRSFTQEGYQSGHIGFDQFYYNKNGGYLTNSLFLFGTAYQFL